MRKKHNVDSKVCQYKIIQPSIFSLAIVDRDALNEDHVELNDLHEGDVWFDHICYGAEFRV
jgi:hypothetical protein